MIEYCKKIALNKILNASWKSIIEYCERRCNFDTQEIIKVQMIELFPSISDPLAENMSEEENMFINSAESIKSLLQLIVKKYEWSINTDFEDKNNTYLFWYTSQKKLEPRLGERYNEKGAHLEQPLGIGKLTKDLYNFLINNPKTHKLSVGEFLLDNPEFRGIIRRIQTLSNYEYAEVNDNILAKGTMPINMLRFKLSFFGASRYDPKSDRWLRVSFFPGAPFYKNLTINNVDEWGFATMGSYK